MRSLGFCVLLLVAFCSSANASDRLSIQAKWAVMVAKQAFTGCSLLVRQASLAYRSDEMAKFAKLQSDQTRCELQAPLTAKKELDGLRKSAAAAGKSDAPIKEFYLAFKVAIGKLGSSSTPSELAKIEEFLQSKGDRMVAEFEW